MRLHQGFCHLRLFPEKLRSAYQYGRDGLLLVHQHPASRRQHQAAHPGFHRPHAVQLALPEQAELFGVGSRQNRHVPAALRHMQAAAGKPGAGGNILRIPQLGSSNHLAAEIRRLLQRGILRNHQGGASLHSSGNHPDILPAGTHKRIDGRAGPHISQFNGPGEHGFHGAGARIVHVPVDPDILSGSLLQPFFKPPLPLPGKMMRYQALHMCHVGKMTEVQLHDIGIFLLLLSAGNSQQA